MLKVFADESGTHDVSGKKPGSDVAGVVGYIGWEWQWNRLEEAWRRCLGMYQVQDFHMAKFMRHKERPYSRWSQPKRQMFRRRLVQIIRENTEFGLGGLLVVQDYAALMPPELYVHPYLFCFQIFLDTILKRIEQLPGFKPEDRVAFIFDENQQFKPEALEAFERIKKARDIHGRIGSITFGTRANEPALQAADMIAWTLRDYLTRRRGGTAVRAWIKGFAKGDGRDLEIGYYDKDNLPLAIAGIVETARRMAANADKGDAK